VSKKTQKNCQPKPNAAAAAKQSSCSRIDDYHALPSPQHDIKQKSKFFNMLQMSIQHKLSYFKAYLKLTTIISIK